MYRIRHLLLLLTVLFAGYNVQAQTQSPYKYDFNSPIDTSDPEFAPLGWGHIVDAMVVRSNTYYVQYAYQATGGVDDSGCLHIGSQTVTDSLTQTQTLNDILVLPPVGGTITVDVKALNYGSDIKFYYVNFEDGKFTTDGLIDMPVPELSEDRFCTITVPEMAEGTYIGIRGNSVLIDNVTATTAEVTPLPRMKVLKVSDANPEYVDAASDGNFTLNYSVQLRNNGQRDLKVGDENYSLSLVNTTLNNRVVGTTAMTEDLALGAETTATLTVTLPYASYPKNYSYAVRDNLTGELTPCGERQAYPYEPVATMLDRSGKPVGDAIDLGIVQGEVTYSYLLRNDGATPLDITNVSMTGGFSTAFKAQQVAPHAALTFPITFGQVGTENQGTLTLETNSGTVEIALSATSVAANEMYANFENGKMPAGYIVGESWFISDFPLQANLPNNIYCAQAQYDVEPTRLITPMLKVKSGDVLHFDAARRDDATFLRVYYSTDRKNWTLAHTIEGTGTDNNTFSPFNLISDSRYSGEFRSYTVENLPAGNLYLAFESAGARLDNIYGMGYAKISHDVMFQLLNLPTVATVNSESQASVRIVNNHPADMAKGAYAVSLYRDGKKVATAAEAEFLAGESRLFDLTFTPHEGGTANYYAAFEVGGQILFTSDTVAVQVLAETSNSLVQVGNPTFPVTNNSTPVAPYYKHSESDAIYKAAQLGLEPGTRIKGIIIRGWNESKELPTNLKVWMCNTDDAVFTSPFAVHNTDTMQQVFDDVCTFPIAGNKTETAEMMNITFKNSFVYDGRNLSIFMHADVPSGYSNVRFETDKSYLQGQSVHRKSDSDLTDKDFTLSEDGAPVITFVTESTASTPLTGVVTAEADGTPIAHANVTLTADNVQYAATTAEDGSYQLNVFKTDRAYTFRAEAIGYEPYKQEVSSFAEAVNASLKEGHGVYIDNVTMPETFTVNNRSNILVDVMNIEPTDLEAGAWTASLVDGEGYEKVSYATPALKAGEKATLNFRYTPHAEGEMALRAKIVAHGTTTQSALFQYVVAPESTGGSVQVLDSTNLADYAVPVRLYDKNSESQTIYTADQLGIPAGSTIQRIAFRGYQSGFTTKEYEANLRVYIENTDDDYELGFVAADTTAMTRIYNDTLAIKKDGTKKNPAEVIVVEIPEGFRYTGKNLRLAFHVEASEYTKMAFVTDKKVRNSFYRGDDNLDKLATASWDQNESPVMYLEVQSTNEFSGHVINGKGVALANVSVQLQSGDVVYSSMTNEEGYYQMKVAQPLLKYNAIFKLDTYKTDTVAVDFLRGDVVLDHQMARPYRLTGSVKGFNGATTDVLDDVTVKLVQGDMVLTTETNDNGNYALDVRDAEGEYQLIFVKEKYQSDTTAVTFDQQSLVREATLLRLNTLSGTIYAKRGEADPEPLMGATINVLGLAGATGNFLLESDADGHFSVDIPAGNGLYGIYVTMVGLNAANKTVTMSADDLQAPDIILLDAAAAGVDGVVINDAARQGDVYTLNGELVGRNLDLNTLPKGLYIVNGRKVVVK